jgi:hypothetical protein
MAHILTANSLFRSLVLQGKRDITAVDWPVFCYDDSKYDPTDPLKGLFEGPLLLRYWRHIFTGPASVEGGRSHGRLPRGVLHGLTKPTPQTIAYTAVLVRQLGIYLVSRSTNLNKVRWVLSSKKSMDPDGNFDLTDFYYSVLELLDSEMPQTTGMVTGVDEHQIQWRQDVMRWWEA